MSEINKEPFKKLYYNRSITIIEIAKILGISRTTVKALRRRFGITSRDFHCCKPHYNPNLISSSNLTYILGVLLGDGCAYKIPRIYKGKKNGTQYILQLRTTEKDFAQSFCDRLVSLGLNPNISRNPSEPKVFTARAYSKTLYDWYSKLSRVQIEEIATQYPIDFIRGFYESEGLHNKKRKAVSMWNNDLDLLQLVKRVLEKSLGLHFRINGPYPEYILTTAISNQTNEFLNIIQPCIKQ